MSKIEWTEESWNPVIGCAKVSAGCTNCYAEKMAYRQTKMDEDSPYCFVMDGKRWNGDAIFLPNRLDQPLRWKKARKIFVNSMSDLFHEDISFEQIAAVYGVMAACPQHTFQVLTKRPARALEFFEWLEERAEGWSGVYGRACFCAHEAGKTQGFTGELDEMAVMQRDTPWPLPNVWLGVSVEDQSAADERIPLLLRCPAAVRFLSAEPLLGAIDLRRWLPCIHGDPDQCPSIIHRTCCQCDSRRDSNTTIDWVIFGGESGPGARLCNVLWIYDGVLQCQEARVAAFVKQLGSNVFTTTDSGGAYLTQFKHSKAGDPAEWPEDLRVREWPGLIIHHRGHEEHRELMRVFYRGDAEGAENG